MLTVVVKELWDQVNMGQDHASAAVALEAKLIESLAKSELAFWFLERLDVRRAKLTKEYSRPAQADQGTCSTCCQRPMLDKER